MKLISLTPLVKQIIERPLTSKEKKSKEKIVKGLKGKKDLDKSAKYAIATAQAKKMNETNLPINTPRDLIDNDILNIPDGDINGIKKAATQLGINPQNKYESELRDEIEDLLTSPMSIYEEYELVKKYFGDYADELIHQYGLKIDEDDRSEKDKMFDLAQQLNRLTPEDREKLKKIQQMIAKEKNEEKISGFDYHYTKGTSGGTQQFGRPRMVNESLKETLKKRAGIIK